MPTITFDLPDGALSALRLSPTESAEALAHNSFRSDGRYDRTRHNPGLRRRCSTARTRIVSSVSRKYTA